jgi:DNA-binding transcriptional LysR family regulator
MLEFDLNLLVHLSVLVETRSVTAAAERAGISQPAMSRSLARLRDLLGDPLLVRTRGGMLPTRRAEELIEPLRSWLGDAARMVSPPRVAPEKIERRFRLVASEYGLRTVLAESLPAVRAAAPGVAIDILAPDADDAGRLASGAADLLLTAAEPDRRLVHDRLVRSEPWMSVARAGHPLREAARSGRPPGLAQLILWPHVGVAVGGRGADPVARAMRLHGLEHRIVATFPYLTAAADLLASSDALMLLPAAAAREAASLDGRLAAFDGPPDVDPFGQWLVWHNRSHRDPAAMWLVDRIAAACGAPGAQQPPALLAAE